MTLNPVSSNVSSRLFQTVSRVAAVAGVGAASLLLGACASSGTASNGAAGSARDAEVAVGSSEGAASVDLGLMDETPIAASSAMLYVEGLSCPACATNVDQQLMDIDGVKSVRVNLGDGTVDVSLGGGARPSRAVLARAIHDSGFTLTRIVVPQ